ncbi:LysR family transcriptional regulator [Salmonella enterica subsp. enterica]|uniref:LysR family transcriptional regulator n=1 Tax=Salmonella enterica I TaxID=59201 RepID=A0A447N5W0_SALET|nr:LysR family transcriptional regulator [Salmonella enterica subsp. enterica]
MWLLTWASAFYHVLPVERELSTGQLKELPFGAPSLSIMALCAHHAGKAVSPAMQIFMQCMEACFTVEDKKMPG